MVGDLAGARLAAFVSTVAGAGVSAAELSAHSAETLPEHMVPSSVQVLQRLPVTANGKIDRAALRDLAESAAHPDAAAPAGPPGDDPTSVESRLCLLVRELLAVPDVRPGDNFFKLGGHSVLATRLAGRLRDEWGITVPIRAVFEAATLSELALVVQASNESIPTGRP
ncbi:phosphopantetheine-binding protein [Verrucosispora sioxanthis]|uniref:phosphopantetheine-binding protein n=1 Tax=Verrucosispora sioxanthis TaxID=2499994 RepID=UPI00359FAD7E